MGIIVFILVGFISYYTCNLVVKHSLFKVRYDASSEESNNNTESINSESPNYNSIGGESKTQSFKIGKVSYTKKTKRQIKSIFDIKDFSQVCVEHLGKWSEILCILTSIVILVGASIAYHIFMKDCLVSIIDGIANIEYDQSVIYPWENNGPPWYWNGIFASLIIVVVLYPITLFKNLNFLVKFNSFGIFFVLFLLVFIIYASIEALVSPFEMSANVASVSSLTISALGLFGSNSATPPASSSQDSYNIADDVIRKGDEVLVNHLKLFDIHFSHLLAILSLSFFIHNVIGPILKNQKSLKHTQRDTGVAFIVAGMIYAVPGILGAFAYVFF